MRRWFLTLGSAFLAIAGGCHGPEPEATEATISTTPSALASGGADDMCMVTLDFRSTFRECAQRCKDQGDGRCGGGLFASGHHRYCNTPDVPFSQCADIAKDPDHPGQDCRRDGIGIDLRKGVDILSGPRFETPILGEVAGPHSVEGSGAFEFMPKVDGFPIVASRKASDLVVFRYLDLPCNALPTDLSAWVRMRFEDLDGTFNVNERFYVNMYMGTWLYRCLSLERGQISAHGTVGRNVRLSNGRLGAEPLLCQGYGDEYTPKADCYDNAFRVDFDVVCDRVITQFAGTCGDGKCNNQETAATCDQDCGTGAVHATSHGTFGEGCGDGVCKPGQEDCANCPCDCSCPFGETCFASPTRPGRGSCQPSSPACGNGTCEPGEDCGNCYSDCRCGAEQTCEGNQCIGCGGSVCGCGHKATGGGNGPCGDHVCSPENNEFCETCPQDCGACPALPTVGPVLIGPKLCASSLRPTFSWHPAQNATHYWLFIADENDRVVASINPFEGTSYTPDFDLVSGRGYRWKVKALHTASSKVNLPWSEIAYFTPRTSVCPSPTVPPTLNGPTQCAALNPTFSWNAVPNANGYNFVLFKVVPPNDVLVVNEAVSGLSYTYRGSTLEPSEGDSLHDGQLYRWKVKAANSDPAALGGPYSPHAFFTARSGPCPVCGNGVTEAGEDCDGGPCCTGVCRFERPHVLCRPSAGPCDVADSCTGASGQCPPDELRIAGARCRDSTGGCDAAETCTGSSPSCPPDTGAVAPAGTVCGVQQDACDAPELCDGTSSTCPASTGALLPAGTVCRPPRDLCDRPETCTGSSTACPPDDGSLQPAGQVCRAAAGPCDATEICSGAALACPTDAPAPNGTSCSGGAGQCTAGTCAENVAWTRLAGATAGGNSVSKMGADGWNAGGVSTKVIRSGDGFVEATLNQTGTTRAFGLNRLDDGVGLDDIDYAIVAGADGSLKVHENGILRQSVGSYAPGDRLRVRIAGGAVQYVRNGVVLFTSNVAAAYPLRADAALFSNGARVDNAVMFGDLAYIASYSPSYELTWTCTSTGPTGCSRARLSYTVASYRATGPEAAIPAPKLFTTGYVGTWATGPWGECDQPCNCGSTYRSVWPIVWNSWGPDAEAPVGQAMCNCHSCGCDCGTYGLYSSQSDCDNDHSCCDGRWRDNCQGDYILCYEGCD